MSQPASDVYEIITETPSGQATRFRSAVDRLVAWFGLSSPAVVSGGLILSVVRKDTGHEVFRHIEEIDDDEDHLFDGIQKDLATMTAAQFQARWVD